MKKSELFFSALQVPVDFLMIILAGLGAFWMRRLEEVQGVKPIIYSISLRNYAEMLLVVATFFILIYAIDGLYDIRSTKRTLKEVYRVFRATSIGIMFIIVFVFLDRDLFSSRFIILAGGFLIVVMVSLGRLIIGYIQKFLMSTRGIGVHRLLLIGVNGYCNGLKKEIEKNKNFGYQVIGHLDKVDLDRIARIKKIKGIDEIIECCPNISKRDLMKLRDYAIRNRITFKYVPALIQTANYSFQVFLGEPLIEIKNTPLDGWGKILKRIFDIIGSLVGILLFGPLMLLATLVIWLESGRPIIFRNERVGHKGEFDLFKFRYMKKEYCHGKQFSRDHNKKAIKFLNELIAKQSIKKGPIYKIKNDPRKTRMGIILEKFSIDEFPQFFNVLLGQMSLVGPRPHQPIEVEKYQDHQRRVLTIKPGITGMAQVSGRSDLSFDEEVRLDTFYIENWSLWRDVKIILATIPAVLKSRKN